MAEKNRMVKPVRTLIVDSFVDKVKTAFWGKALREVIHEELRGSVEVVPYRDFSPAYLEKHMGRFDAVVLSGSDAYLSKAEDRLAFKNAIEAVRTLTPPVLGICGGHQLIGVAHGQKIVNMQKHIEGYREVRLLTDDPLFDGLPERVVVTQSHEEMIENVPEGYSRIGESPDTPVEAMRRVGKGVAYGVQFHPEIHDEDHPAGKIILSNFAKIVSR